MRVTMLVVLGLAMVPCAASAQRIAPPTSTRVTAARAVELPPDAAASQRLPASGFRRASQWKGAILLGAVAGTVFGVMVATQAGDQGSDRRFSDRLSDGLVAGAMLAVPVTVIFALVTSDGN